MEEPNQILKQEHHATEELLNAMDGMAIQAGVLGKPPVKDIEKALTVIIGFVDKCHHMKEEKVLFPSLSRASPDVGAELARRLTSDHLAFRQLADSMKTALTRVGSDSQARTLLVKHIGTYTRLVRAHIGVEETDLFREVDKAIQPDERAEISIQFERIEENVVGHGMHEKYHSIVESLSKKYGP